MKLDLYEIYRPTLLALTVSIGTF